MSKQHGAGTAPAPLGTQGMGIPQRERVRGVEEITQGGARMPNRVLGPERQALQTLSASPVLSKHNVLFSPDVQPH